MLKLFNGGYKSPFSQSLNLYSQQIRFCNRFFSNRSVFKDSIYALSTGFGKSAIAVIRISGDSAFEALKLTKPQPYQPSIPQPMTLKPRYAQFKKLYDIFDTPSAETQQVNDSKNPQNKKMRIIDEGIVLTFKGPKSFTGEDMVELQIHGGNAVKQKMLQTLCKIPSFRQAEPVSSQQVKKVQGEFTKRAYYNGKLDLLKAEGLHDLINAESEEQLKLSQLQLQGRHSAIYTQMREQLIRMLAHAEAYIDFEADETNDLKPQLFVELGKETQEMAKKIEKWIEESKVSEVIREGFKIAILGPPNAGKSTLLNYLAKRRVAIVSPIPGTTRDLITTSLNLFGYTVHLTDTAGLREQTNDIIEQEGMALAHQASQNSHGVLFVLDHSDLIPLSDKNYQFRDTANSIINQLELIQDSLILLNKIDLAESDQPSQQRCTVQLPNGSLKPALRVSLERNLNLDSLMSDLETIIKNQIEKGIGSHSNDSDAFLVTRSRHLELLQETLQCLNNFSYAEGLTPDMAVEELRGAIFAIGRITGQIDVEDVLDVLFREFCIGK